MSTMRQTIQPRHPIRRRRIVAAIVSLVLFVAVATAATRFETTSIESGSTQLTDARAVPATRVPAKTTSLDKRGRPHGRYQMPKQAPARDAGTRPHGPNQMPRR
jgi:hypothetical protein